MLTIQQLQTLKALALADPVASGYLTSGNDSELANWFNADTTWVVWRSALSQRTASRAEKALSIGTGTTASPDTLGWEGQISYSIDAPLIREA